MTRKLFRLALAQKICRPLPPLISQRVRTVIYPQALAFRDDYEFEVQALTGSRFTHRTSDFHGYPFSVHGYYELEELGYRLGCVRIWRSYYRNWG